MSEILRAGWLAIIAFDDLAAAISTHFGNSLTKQDILRYHALEPGTAAVTISRCKKAIGGEIDRIPRLRAVREFMLQIIDFDENIANLMIDSFKEKNQAENLKNRFDSGRIHFLRSPSLPKYFSKWESSKQNWIDLTSNNNS